jgi:hypothetical protein
VYECNFELDEITGKSKNYLSTDTSEFAPAPVSCSYTEVNKFKYYEK